MHVTYEINFNNRPAGSASKVVKLVPDRVPIREGMEPIGKVIADGEARIAELEAYSSEQRKLAAEADSRLLDLKEDAMRIISQMTDLNRTSARAPNDSYKAKADSLALSLQTVTTQQQFEAEHFAMHSTNMANAVNEVQTLKTHVRAAREAQRMGGNQYPALKIYVADKK